MSRIRIVTLPLIVLLLIAGIGPTSLNLQHRTREHSQSSVPDFSYLGVVTPAPTADDLRAFAETTGVQPNLSEYYIPWGTPFDRVAAKEIASMGALPMISWEPFTRTTTLADIAYGKQDAYINSWAHVIAAYHHHIAISFAAEMNGSWEDWGPTHATAAQFVSAWHRIHNLFAKADATNVIWVWTVNIVNGPGIVPVRPYWPGAPYVDWVGMDGYWWGRHSTAGSTFSEIFGPTLAQIRQFTNNSVLICETGGVPGYKVTAVRDLFSGIEHTSGMLGFVWFNVHDWRLQDSTAATAAYRLEAKNANFIVSIPTPTGLDWFKQALGVIHKAL